MAEVKWIKVYVSILTSAKIKRIRRMPDGDTLALIWVYLMAQAGESNKDGALYFTETIPYSAEEFALQYDFKVDTVKLAVATFEKFGMVEIYDAVIYIKNWNEYQNANGLEKIREQNRKRIADYRAKQKLVANNSESNVTCNVTVTQCNATDIDKEIDIDKDNNYIVEDNNENLCKSIIDYLNEKAKTNFRASSKATKTLIHARLSENFTLDDFKAVIDNKVSDWLNDTKMREYLRPLTLFGTKFESYLNAKPKTKYEHNDADDVF